MKIDSDIEAAAQLLERRADGYASRASAIFNGKIMAEELRANATEIRALSDRHPHQPVQEKRAETIEECAKIASTKGFEARMAVRSARGPRDRSKALGAEEAAQQIEKAIRALSRHPHQPVEGKR